MKLRNSTLEQYSVANENGVYVEDQCEVLRGQEGKPFTDDGWRAAILLAHPGPCDWRIAIELTVGHTSSSAYPNKRGQLYQKRQAALHAAVQAILRELTKMEKQGESKQIIRAIRLWANDQFQLRLI